MSSILEDITSGDGQRIWAGACAIATLRDSHELDLLSAHLSEIEQKTTGIELGGALFPNREHLNFALRKLRFYKAKSGCLCRLYPDRLMFSPSAEEEAGNIRVLESLRSDGQNDFYVCQCIFCGTRFRVEEGEYHYTWWQWNIEE